MAKKLEATEMWFLWIKLRISWTAKKSNETVLREIDTIRSLINRIHKWQANFFGHVMRRVKLEHLMTIGMIKVNAAGENSVKRCSMDC